MAEAHAEVAQRAIEMIYAGNRAAWDDLIDRGVEYTPVRQWPESSTRYGIDALWRFTREVISDWDKYEISVRDVREQDDRVLLEATVRGVGKESGIELKGRLFHVLTLRDGRIVKIQDFLAKSDAYRAAGLPT
jgi:ketosteroid isomerase-like protein